MLRSATFCLVLMSALSSTSAQIVQVGAGGGVQVRVPFAGVAVDVLPFGLGTRVRAPFTAVDTGIMSGSYPATPYSTPYVEQYSTPYVEQYPQTQPSVVDEAFSEQRLFDAASTLRRSISQRVSDPDIWLEYLKPDAILQSLKKGGPTQDLRNVLLNYQGVMGTPSLANIRSLPGFVETHRLLTQWLGMNPGVEELPRPEPS